MQAFIVENGFVTQSIMVPNADWPVSDGQTLVVSDIGGIGWVLTEEGTLTEPLTPFSQALQDLNSNYQTDVEVFNKAFSLAIMFDGPTEETKKANIRTQYSARKAKYIADLATLRTQYGV